jgi:4-hydroxy-4-methyl-2-oxoglutarate aldolase
MRHGELADLLAGLGTSALCAAHEGVSSFGGSLHSLSAGSRVAGRARTAATSANQNAAVHRAVHRAQAGDLLVVDGGAERTTALLGDLLGQFCKARGVVGAVVRGCVRDTEGLRALGFPVWCSGTNPASSRKDYPGSIDAPLHFDTAVIRAGDWIVADDDGIAVIPAHAAEEAAAHAQLSGERESIVRERIAAGESTCVIFSIEP